MELEKMMSLSLNDFSVKERERDVCQLGLGTRFEGSNLRLFVVHSKLHFYKMAVLMLHYKLNLHTI